jgi:holliday junction DNA helicase RuvB
MSEPFIESSWTQPDVVFESPLRPQTLSDFTGQDQIRERLEVLIGAAKLRGDPLGHCLFYGPPGLGKTTLAGILAKAMGTQLVTTSGPALEKAGDLAGILSNLKEGDIFFIDEIHRLPRQIEEYLYPAVEDFKLDLLIDSGPAARSVQVKLNPFTLVAATTRAGLVSAPMRSRFVFSCRLDYYEPKLLSAILMRSAAILNIAIEKEGADEIALRARGTPRIANNLLRWVRDFAQIRAKNKIDKDTAEKALSMLSIDHLGLDEMDKKILTILVDHYEGKPVGLNTIAVATGEEPDTIAEVFEPFLIMQGFIKRTPRGREATTLAYKHLGRPLPTFFQSGETS